MVSPIIYLLKYPIRAPYYFTSLKETHIKRTLILYRRPWLNTDESINLPLYKLPDGYICNNHVMEAAKILDIFNFALYILISIIFNKNMI